MWLPACITGEHTQGPIRRPLAALSTAKPTTTQQHSRSGIPDSTFRARFAQSAVWACTLSSPPTRPPARCVCLGACAQTQWRQQTPSYGARARFAHSRNQRGTNTAKEERGGEKKGKKGRGIQWRAEANGPRTSDAHPSPRKQIKYQCHPLNAEPRQALQTEDYGQRRKRERVLPVGRRANPFPLPAEAPPKRGSKSRFRKARGLSVRE